MELASDQISDENSHSKVNRERPSISFFGLFSAADRIDYLLMFLGSVGSCIHGAALPVFFIFFGRMIDSLGNLAVDPHKMSSQVSRV